MLARRALRLAAFEALSRLVDVTVESPGDWDTQPAQMPNIQMRATNDRKVPNGKSSPAYTTTVTLEILCRVQARTQEDCQDALEDLGNRVENALLGETAFLVSLQGPPSVTTRSQITAEGEVHFGGIQILLDCETFETFDATQINPSWFPPLTTIDLQLDAVRPFDGTATYAPGEFPQAVTPAPRTSGPDGRLEGEAIINLPQ